jgi:hypothetical protein
MVGTMKIGHHSRKRNTLATTRWLKFGIVFAALACVPIAHGQAQSSCCGAIDSDGRHLAAFLDSMHVEQLWPAGWHVNWRTGEPERKTEKPTSHCSAFTAAAAARLGIYILRPPEHPQVLLANAQFEWLQNQGAEKGWRRLRGYREAQELANQGQLVVASLANPNSEKPGHIAIVRPSEKSRARLDSDGPEIIQSGLTNYDRTNIVTGFEHHETKSNGWKQIDILYFAHAVDWSQPH